MISIIIGVIIMRPVYNKWINVPMITSIESTNYPVWNISFPAVTICSNNKIVMKQLDELLLEDPWTSISASVPNFKGLLVAALEAYLDGDHEVFKEGNSLAAPIQAFLQAQKNNIPHLLQRVKLDFK